MSRRQASKLHVSDLMSIPAVSVGPDLTAREAARILDEHGVSGAPVVDASDQIVGVVSQRDLVRQAADTRSPRDLGAFVSDIEDYGDLGRRPAGHHSTPVERLMSRKVISVEAEAPIWRAARLMRKHRIHRLIVTREGSLAGVVTSQDLLRVVEKLEPQSKAGAGVKPA